MTRRVPSPWSVEELNACFVVRDSTGQQLAYVYFENKPGRRSAATSMESHDAQYHHSIRHHWSHSGFSRDYRTANPFLTRPIGRSVTTANLLTRDEARRIAANVAKLPGLLRKP